MHLRQVIIASWLAVSLLSLYTVANAAEQLEGVLTCGAQQYTVSGQFHGNSFHLTTGTTNYVVKYAELEPEGTVITDVRGQQDKDLITCSFTSPSDRQFTFM